MGFSLLAMGERGAPLRKLIDETAHAVFACSFRHEGRAFRRLGAMAYTVGKYGPTVLSNLAGLIATFYFTSALFIILVLGTIARFAGFNISNPGLISRMNC